MTKRVAVLGGGVAGMTVAHELRDRRFEVDVYEATTSTYGGKSASQRVPGTGTAGRELPGEHGFRFFPSFYRHVIDTMERIPTDESERFMVVERLQRSEEMAMAEGPGRLFTFERDAVSNLTELRYLSDVVFRFFERTGVPETDMARFAATMWRFLTSSEQRRLAEVERMSFWDYVDGDSYSPQFQKYIETPRFMVAMDPRKGSARTIGVKALQILLDFFRNGTRTDAVLDGPSTDRWLTPWFEHLKRIGVRYHFGRRVTKLDIDRATRRITGAHVDGEPTPIEADYYVLCAPLDRVGALFSDDIIAAEPSLAKVRAMSTHATSWMIGLQFYLKRPIPVCKGHVAYPDSYWSLSSVSQGQFWAGSCPIATTYGDGSVVDILSVDVSTWDEPSPRINKCARDCRRDELIKEVFAQLKDGLADLIDWSDVANVHVDANIEFPPSDSADPRVVNTTPLLVHPPGSWFDRPGAELSGIDNLLLASDYVKTNTDLASMEGANEAARRAVNGILRREGFSPFRDCRIFSMEEDAGAAVEALKYLDRIAFLGEGAGILNQVSSVLDSVGTVSKLTRRSAELPRTRADLRQLEQRALRVVGR